MPAATCCSCKLHNGMVAVAGCLLCAAEVLHAAASCAHPCLQRAPCRREPSSRVKERRVDPRTTLIHAACWHLMLFSACPPQVENFCTATQRMLQNDVLENGISSRGPSSPGAAAGRRDRHQARWVMVEQQWMERSASGRLQLAVGGMIIASAASPKV